jgi:predicted RNA-binding Zn ribbon-like protein
VKTCRNPDCRWAFYDSTRNRSAVWCDMAVCGSRAKSRRYYARQQQR